MRVTINKSVPKGVVFAPPSKSMAHRMLIGAGLSEGTSIIRGISKSEDVLATIDCLEALGAKCDFSEDTVTVTGANLKKLPEKPLLRCRESGSTLRFFIPLCLMSGETVTLTGSEYLFKRPLSVYEELCKKQGIDYDLNGATLKVSGYLKNDNFRIKGNISSQFITGLLYALPLLAEDSTITLIPPVESLSYINLTIQALKTFGVEVKWTDERTIYINPAISSRSDRLSSFLMKFDAARTITSALTAKIISEFVNISFVDLSGRNCIAIRSRKSRCVRRRYRFFAVIIPPRLRLYARLCHCKAAREVCF